MKVSTKTLGVFLLSLMVTSLAGYNTASFGQAQAPPPQPLPGPRGTPIRPAPNAWNPKSIAYIKASNAKKDDQFGYTVALSADGNTMAVGTTAEDSAAKGINGNQADHFALNAGAVYVFNRSGGNWVQQAYVKASNAKASDQFGASLALSGDGNTLAVGATGESSSATGINGNQADTSMAGAGAVYIFTRSGATWSQQAYVKASNTGEKEDGDQFGYSIAISLDGNTLATGAITEKSAATGIQPPNEGSNDAASDVSTGAAYVFVRNGTAWTQQAFIKATNTRLNDQFAWALALSRDGDTLAVGAHLEDSGAIGLNGDQESASAEDSGAVYVYARSAAKWAPVAYVKASNTKASAEFGISLALSGDGKVLAVGAFKEGGGGTGVNPARSAKPAAESGAAYVYY